jgi:hypothetical protein
MSDPIGHMILTAGLLIAGLVVLALGAYVVMLWRNVI